MAIVRSWDQAELDGATLSVRPGVGLGSVLSRSAQNEFLETNPDAMIVAEPSGNILAGNAAAEDLFDLGRGELTGRNLSSLFAGELNGHLALERVQQPDSSVGEFLPRRIEIEGKVRGGTYLPLCLTLTPLTRSKDPLLLAVIRESAYSASTAKQVATAAYRAATHEMMALQKELLTEIAQDNGVNGIARVLHARTGRKVLIIDPSGGVLACAGYAGPHDLPQQPLPARHPGAGRLGSVHGVRERHGDSWTAAACPDQTLLGRISILDPAGDLPEVDLLSLEQAASILTAELLRAQIVDRSNDGSLGELAAALLDGSDPDRNRARARVHRYDLDPAHRAVAVEAPFAGKEAVGVVEQVAKKLGLAAPLVTARATRTILLTPSELDWDCLASTLSDTCGGEVRLGVGLGYPVDELSRSLTEAVFALELGTTAGSGAPVTTFADLGVWKMLVDSSEPRKLREVVAEWIGPLVEHDELHNSELVKTLTIYLKASCAMETAAAALHVHRNTLRYRLSKIYHVSGRDLTDPDQRFHLELACRAWIVLQALEAA